MSYELISIYIELKKSNSWRRHSLYLPAELDGRGADREDSGELEDVTGR